MRFYPIQVVNGEIVKNNTLSPGVPGEYQAQWSDEYMVLTSTDENNKISKNIYIGSISYVEGSGWDLENSDIDYQASFRYYPSAEKKITTGGCEEPIPYDPESEFICPTPVQTTTKIQPGETGILYKNPSEVINRPFLDEGRYEEERTTIFRHSSIGDFENVLTDLDKTEGDHPLTDDKGVISNSIIKDFIPAQWWKKPFTIIDSKTQPKPTDNTTEIIEPSDSNFITLPTRFKRKFVDKITNFNPSTDTLEIDTDSFGIDNSATFAAGKNNKEVKKKLAKQDFDFLYDEKKGGLYFNENGADKGFGDGGIIAILKGAPDLTSDNLGFI